MTVTNMFKKGDRSQPSNYRPISLLSIFDKLLEKLMFNRLISYLERNSILYNYRFGYRKITLLLWHLLMLWIIFIKTWTLALLLWVYILTLRKPSILLTMNY